MANDDLMPTKYDRWGEQIRQERRTFTLAALFRAMTLTAVSAAWIVTIRHSTAFAPLALIVVALLFAMVVAHRQPGTAITKATAFLGFFVGAVFVVGYIPAVRAMLMQFNRVDYRSAWGSLDTMFSLCLAVLAFPAVVYVIVELVRVWIYLANVAADGGGQKGQQE